MTRLGSIKDRYELVNASRTPIHSADILQMLWSEAKSLVIKDTFVPGEKEWTERNSGLKPNDPGSK